MGEKQSAIHEVVLFGTWASAYSKRVELALKVKGIPYEYVEEDLSNKSELLLQHSPVHKKVPVLVHNGKAIAESLVILEYIDETWNDAPKLLPEDPYERAKVRFWVSFVDQKIFPAFLPIVMSKGKEKEKAIEEINELIKVFQDGIERDFPGKLSPFFNGENLGLLDIVIGTNACNYKVFHELVGEIFSPEKHTPQEFISWVNALKEHPLMKDILPPHDKMVAKMRETFSISPKNS